ncbi:hypothetical protein Q7C36_006993 [Tachysurus vachellii]|uniref:Uncharacterized protein n=1 Tax=Tachysurus vachellii TaxID=175792 RepID=A0AA88T019_TACVA|nr:hypothetical protein Q7C36_006993 [Tachysurus vachellii]
MQLAVPAVELQQRTLVVENQGEKNWQDLRGSVIFHTVDFRADRQVPPYYWDCRLTVLGLKTTFWNNGMGRL